MKKYLSSDDYIEPTGELNCGIVKIEKIGYVSPKRQIEALFYSGGQFLPPREDEFDYETLQQCVEDDSSDVPIRDCDIIDISRLSSFQAEELISRGIGNNEGSTVSEPSTTSVTSDSSDSNEN